MSDFMLLLFGGFIVGVAVLVITLYITTVIDEVQITGKLTMFTLLDCLNRTIIRLKSPIK